LYGIGDGGWGGGGVVKAITITASAVKNKAFRFVKKETGHKKRTLREF
jgi:hypothetical protein